MGSVIFVHGTGVRKDSYERTFEIVRGELRAERPLLQILPCLWGDRYGVKLNADGASIPTYATARAVAHTVEDENIALWAMLYSDPLYELRLLASRKEDATEVVPGQDPPWQTLQNAIDQFQLREDLKVLLEKSSYYPFWSEAWHEVSQSGELQDSLRGAGSSAGEHRKAIARASVAYTTILATQGGCPTIDGAVRDQAVALVVANLGGQEMGISTWVSDQFKGLAARMATRYLTRKRGAISDQAYPNAGDVLLYQVHGDGIRNFISEVIAGAVEPVTLLAHSLGGIACVDLLATTPQPKVARLITAGSQAPFLYEIDCLPSLRFGVQLPDHFPEWLNIYDERDLLSYVGEGIFRERIHDFRVDNGQPFPESHGAYWINAKVWKKIVEFLP